LLVTQQVAEPFVQPAGDAAGVVLALAWLTV
jgi:hypothetical protein